MTVAVTRDEIQTCGSTGGCLAIRRLQYRAAATWRTCVPVLRRPNAATGSESSTGSVMAKRTLSAEMSGAQDGHVPRNACQFFKVENEYALRRKSIAHMRSCSDREQSCRSTSISVWVCTVGCFASLAHDTLPPAHDTLPPGHYRYFNFKAALKTSGHTADHEVTRETKLHLLTNKLRACLRHFSITITGGG